jgi:hypothetical protein
VFTTTYDPESTKVATVTYPDGLVATTSYGCAAVVNGATTCLNPNSGVTLDYILGRSVTTPAVSRHDGNSPLSGMLHKL